jgi:hypothetical protein
MLGLLKNLSKETTLLLSQLMGNLKIDFPNPFHTVTSWSPLTFMEWTSQELALTN